MLFNVTVFGEVTSCIRFNDILKSDRGELTKHFDSSDSMYVAIAVSQVPLPSNVVKMLFTI